MTNKIMRSILLIACLVMVFSQYAAAGVKDSLHDFRYGSGSPSNFAGKYKTGTWATGTYVNEICVFCHTPHGASTEADYQLDGNNVMLWNRVITQQLQAPGGFTPYTSASFTALYSQNPTGLSLMCLSCHDGVTSIAVGSLLNRPGSGNLPIDFEPSSQTSIGEIYWADGTPGHENGGPNIGNLSPDPLNIFNSMAIDLTNDHPVSFPWPSGYQDIKLPIDTRLRLFGSTSRLECSTCHNVHNNQYPPFLAMPNSNSDMCLQCHNK